MLIKQVQYNTTTVYKCEQSKSNSYSYFFCIFVLVTGQLTGIWPSCCVAALASTLNTVLGTLEMESSTNQCILRILRYLSERQCTIFMVHCRSVWYTFGTLIIQNFGILYNLYSDVN